MSAFDVQKRLSSTLLSTFSTTASKWLVHFRKNAGMLITKISMRTVGEHANRIHYSAAFYCIVFILVGFIVALTHHYCVEHWVAYASCNLLIFPVFRLLYRCRICIVVFPCILYHYVHSCSLYNRAGLETMTLIDQSVGVARSGKALRLRRRTSIVQGSFDYRRRHLWWETLCFSSRNGRVHRGPPEVQTVWSSERITRCRSQACVCLESAIGVASKMSRAVRASADRPPRVADDAAPAHQSSAVWELEDITR